MEHQSKQHPQITLYRGWGSPNRYVWSPFVTKLEFLLRTSQVPYTTACGSFSAAPRGKIPYIALFSSAENPTPEILGDSGLISKRLRSDGILQDANAQLSAVQRGRDLAIRALMEDKLAFYHTHERWVKNYYVMREHALWAVPWAVRPLVGLLAYRGNVRKLYDQGTGRFSDEEILGSKTEIWEAVEGMLADSRIASGEGDGRGCYWVLGGEEPTEADAVVYGFVVSVMVSEAGPESKQLLVERFGGVVAWAERVHRRWFADYDMWR